MKQLFVYLGLYLALNMSLIANDCCNTDFCLRYNSYKTSHIWNKQSKKIKTWNNFKLLEFQLFGNVYFSKDDCLSLNASYMQIEETLNGNTRGFTDPEATWTHCVYKTKTEMLSTQATAIIPSGEQKYELRYGRFGGEFGLLFSKILHFINRDFFLDLSTGYRIYTGFPSDQLRGSFIFGSYATHWLYLELRQDVNYGVYNGKSELKCPLVRLNANYRVYRVQLRGVVNLYKNFYLGGGYLRNIWGQNVGTGGGFFAEAWAIF